MSYVVYAIHRREENTVRISEHGSCLHALKAMRAAVASGEFVPHSVGVSVLSARVEIELARRVEQVEAIWNRMFTKAEAAGESDKAESLWMQVSAVQSMLELAERSLATHRVAHGL